VEVGTGKGGYSLQMAALYPEERFVAVEKNDSAAGIAAKKYDEEGTDNLLLIWNDARFIDSWFAPEEVDVIHLNFSDPWPKARHAGRRLTSREFLARYDRVLAEDGTIEFKTDNRLLFDFSVSEVNVSSAFHMRGCTYDLHHDDTMNHGNIMTEYEEKFSSLGNPICKLIVGRNS